VKPVRGTLHVFPDAGTLAEGAAAWLTARALQSRDRFVLSLAGGSTPKRLYADLVSAKFIDKFPWARTVFVFGDERFVAPNDPESNARMVDEAMFSHAPVDQSNIYRVPTVATTPEQAAADYAATLQKLYGADRLTTDRPLLDVALLGVGDDGHTASLIPGEPVTAERSAWVGVAAHGRPEARITLTFPALESSGAVAFLLQGKGKTAILDRLLSGDESVPAGQLRPHGELHWFADQEAAGAWGERK
jgi:6-phosphogluconolactonase